MIYRGFWIICRNCSFPIRLPYEPHGVFVHGFSEQNSTVVLACPVCAQAVLYRRADVETVGFRIPDPFRSKKAVLYTVEVGCASSQCQNEVRIYAVAATSVSVASLLEVWRYWVIHLRCPGHPFKPRPRRMWGISSVDVPR
jgi:hypothetical protein